MFVCYNLKKRYLHNSWAYWMLNAYSYKTNLQDINFKIYNKLFHAWLSTHLIMVKKIVKLGHFLYSYFIFIVKRGRLLPEWLRFPRVWRSGQRRRGRRPWTTCPRRTWGCRRWYREIEPENVLGSYIRRCSLMTQLAQELLLTSKNGQKWPKYSNFT